MQEPNSDYIKQSLLNQISSLSYKLAEYEAIITELQIELDELNKEKIAEMDSEK